MEEVRSKLERARKAYNDKGYTIISGLFSRDVHHLRSECDRITTAASTSRDTKRRRREDAEVLVSRSGCIFEVLKVAHGDDGAMRRMRNADELAVDRASGPILSKRVADILTSKSLLDCVRSILNCEDLYYFNEQYIVKPPLSSDSAFRWHRDSDWCVDDSNVTYVRYCSLWVPLDDVSEENGTLFASSRDEAEEDRGEGVPIVANAGDCVIMSDRMLHRSCRNMSADQRRVWMPQFSCGPILWKKNEEPVSFAIKM